MKPLLIIFICLVSFWGADGQSISDYHLEAGLSVGYRYLDMTEVNDYYAFEGLGHIQYDPYFPNMKYSYNGTVKPFNNTVAFSGYLTWKPFKNKGFNLTVQYDFIPSATRKLTITRQYEVDVTQSNTGKVTNIDSIKDIIPESSTITLQSGNAVIGYDFMVGKVLFNVGLGLSYNTFRISGTSQQNSYQSYTPVYGQTSYQQGTPIYVDYPANSAIYGKANGFGFLVRLSASYKLTKRLSANLQFTTHAAELTIYDIPYYDKYIWYQRTIPIIDNYNINIVDYLSAQLSGVQISGGISYRLF